MKFFCNKCGYSGDEGPHHPNCGYMAFDLEAPARELADRDATIAALKADNAALRSALEPFAKCWERRITHGKVSVVSFYDLKGDDASNAAAILAAPAPGADLLARLAEAERSLAEWRDYFGCEDPHDSALSNSHDDDGPLGKEQARANRLGHENRDLREERDHLEKVLEALHARPSELPPYKLRGPAQMCKRCGAIDNQNFSVSNEYWSAVTAPEWSKPKYCDSVLCLACFDDLAAERGIKYELTSFIFAGKQLSTDFVEERDALRKQVAELQADKARLDWLCHSDAMIAYSKDGDDCWLHWPYLDDEFGTPGNQQGTFISPRAAIDAAMNAAKERKS